MQIHRSAQQTTSIYSTPVSDTPKFREVSTNTNIKFRSTNTFTAAHRRASFPFKLVTSPQTIDEQFPP